MKKIIFATVLVIVLSGCTNPYITSNVQNSKATSTSIELQEKCMKLGKEYQVNEKQRITDSHTYAAEPNYFFNKNLNTCLYEGGTWKVGGTRYNYIIDLYTNKRLTESTYEGNKLVFGLTDEEFKLKSNELMSGK